MNSKTKVKIPKYKCGILLKNRKKKKKKCGKKKFLAIIKHFFFLRFFCAIEIFMRKFFAVVCSLFRCFVDYFVEVGGGDKGGGGWMGMGYGEGWWLVFGCAVVVWPLFVYLHIYGFQPICPFDKLHSVFTLLFFFPFPFNSVPFFFFGYKKKKNFYEKKKKRNSF